MNKNRKLDIIICALLAGLVCIYFSKLIFLNLAFGNYDSLSAWFQMKHLAFHSGATNFWNPYMQAGYPFFGNVETGQFSPLSILHVFLDFGQAEKWSIIIFIIAGGIGMYYYARYLAMTRPGAFLAAVVFTFCAYTIQYREMMGLTLLPWILLNYEKTLHGNKKTNLIAVIVLISLVFLNGMAQWMSYLFCIMLIYWLYESYFNIRGGNTKKTLRNLGLLFLIIIVSMLICSYKLLPSYELVKESVRGQGLTYEKFALGSMAPWNLIELFVPTFFGAHLNSITNWAGGQYGSHLYIGILPLLLALAVFIFKPGKKICLFGIIALFSLVISAGRYSPFFKAIYHLPGLNIFRVHCRVLWIFSFSMAVLAGFGLDAVLKKNADRFCRKYGSFLKILLAVMALTIIVITGLLLFKETIYGWGEQIIKTRYVGQLGHPWPYEYYVSKMKLIYGLWLKGLSAFMVLYGLSLISLFLLKKSSSRLVIGFSCAVVVLNLFWYSTVLYLPAADAKIFRTKPDYTNFLEKDSEIFRVFSLGGAVSPNLSMVYGYQDIKGYEFVMLDRFYKYMKTASLKDTEAGSARLMGFDPTEDMSEYNKKFIDYLNVKYIISPRKIEAPGYRFEFLAAEHNKRLMSPLGEDKKHLSLWALKKDSPDVPNILLYSDKIYIYSSQSYLPRAFLVNDFLTLASESEILDRLKDPRFEPRACVIIEETLDREIKMQSDIAPNVSDPVKIENYSPDRVDIAVEASQAGFLVLHDIYYPGWTAYIDGCPTHTYRANYLFRAVLIDKPGRHKVSFVFRPQHLPLGLALTSLGIVSLAVLFFVKIPVPGLKGMNEHNIKEVV